MRATETLATRCALSGLLGLLFTVGCGPIYETQYSFTPPKDSHGQMCVMHCENSKLQCEQIEDLQKDRCEDRAAREYDRCKRRGEKYCYEESCSSDYERCERQYRSCFQACGGKVHSQEVCVSFCDQKR